MFIVIRAKRLIAIFLVLLAIILSAFGATAATKKRSQLQVMGFPLLDAPIILIDAGHGGVDKGAIGKVTGLEESEVNLDIALKTQTKLKALGFEVVMTRTTQEGLYTKLDKGFKKEDMRVRGEIIESSKADLAVSIHVNKCNYSTRRGVQVFYTTALSLDFANTMQQRVNIDLNEPILNKGYSALLGDYFVLRKSPCPAVIVECGFLSNEKDEALLAQEAHRQNLADCILKGITDYISSSNTALSSNMP